MSELINRRGDSSGSVTVLTSSDATSCVNCLIGSPPTSPIRLIEGADTIVARFDRQHRHLYISNTIEKSAGIPATQFLGKTNQELGLPPEHCSKWDRAIDDAFAQRAATPLEFEFLSPGGAPLYFRAHLIPEPNALGEIETVASVTFNVTRLHEQERALQATARKFEATFDQAAVGIAHVGLHGELIRINRKFCDIVGYSQEELKNRTFLEITHPDDLQRDLAKVRQLLAGEISTYSMEKRYIRKNGSPTWINLTCSLVCTDVGTPDYIIAVVEEISRRKEAQEALRISEQRLRNSLNTGRAMMFEWTRATDVVIRSSNAGMFFGNGPQANRSTGQEFISVIHPDDRPSFVAMLEKLINRQQRGYGIEFRIVRADNTIVWCQEEAEGVYDENDQLQQVSGLMVDITQRKQAEDLVKRQARFLDVALQAAELGTWQFNLIDHTWDYDARAQRLYGLATPNFVHDEEGVRAFLHPDDIQPMWNAVRAATDPHGDGRYAVQYRVKIPEGGWRWLSAWGLTDFEGEGSSRKAVRIIGASRDITLRRHAEDSLKQSEEKFRMLADNMSQIAWMASASGEFLWFNKQWFDFTGAADNDVAGSRWQEYIHPDHREHVATKLRQHVADGETWEDTFPLRASQGDYRWFLGRATPIRSADGQIVRWFGTGTDVTDLRQRQEEVQRLNRTLKALSDSSKAISHARQESEYLNDVCRIIVEDCGHAMVWIGYAQHDQYKSVLSVASFGFESGYLESLRVSWGDNERGNGPTGTAIKTARWNICHNMQSDPRVSAWRKEAMSRGYQSSIALPLIRDGAAFGALMIYSRQRDPFTPSEIELLSELAEDLSAGITSLRLRKATEEDHASLARLHGISARLVSQDSLDTLLQEVIDAAVVITSADKGTLQLVDTASNALIIRAQHGCGDAFIQHFSTLGHQAASCGEAQRTLRQVVIADIAESAVFKDTPELSVLQAEGIRAVHSTPLVARDGTLLGVFSTHWCRHYVPDEGTLQRVDILAREAAHLIEHRQREQALAAAKINAEHAREVAENASRAKDHFLAVLSHELRTPLNPALIAASILEKNPRLTPDLKEDVSMIRRNIELEARLIDDMLDLTRIARGKLTLNRYMIDGCEVLKHAVETCRAEAAEKELQVVLNLPELPVEVDADPARLQQVFWNLLKNAIKFTPDHGRITVTARSQSAGGLHVEVTDTGKGIEQEAITRIFDAFEQGSATINKRYGGLGLGLAICKGLVSLHDGSIFASSDGPGKGSTFIVTLPPPAESKRVSAHAAGNLQSEPAGKPVQNSHILLVEDHEHTAVMTDKLLRSFGYRVTTARSVGEAVDKYLRGHFDLLISDLGLPDGSGHDLIAKLSANGPVRAIALSGFGMESDIQQSVQAGFREHLVKPINVRQLEDAIHRVLATESHL